MWSGVGAAAGDVVDIISPHHYCNRPSNPGTPNRGECSATHEDNIQLMCRPSKFLDEWRRQPLSDLPGPRTCPLRLTWQATRAGNNPRFFLTSHFLSWR